MTKSEDIIKAMSDEELEILNLCVSSDNVMEAMRIYGHIPAHGKEVFHSALKNENDSRHVDPTIKTEHEEIINTLRPWTESYITSNVFTGETCKGEAHWQICKLLCEYVTGRPYGVSQGSLELFIHKITTPITDHLDTTIGLQNPNQYALKKRIDIKNFARLLSVEMLVVVDSCDKDELEWYARKSEGDDD